MEVGKNGSWQKWKLAKMQVGKNASWQKCKLAKMEVGKNASWQKWKLKKRVKKKVVDGNPMPRALVQGKRERTHGAGVLLSAVLVHKKS